MTKKVFVTLAAFGMLLLPQYRAFAQAGLSDGLEGTYTFETAGEAFLPNGGQCAANGSVLAALTDGSIKLDGRGGLSGSNLGISIGATTCSSPNYNVSGTYTIEKKGDQTIEASGTLTMSFVGRGAACSGTLLVSQPFTLIATTNEFQAATSFTIETSGAGAGSTYAEGPPPGPLSCSARIMNFVTKGTGKLLSASPAALAKKVSARK